VSYTFTGQSVSREMDLGLKLKLKATNLISKTKGLLLFIECLNLEKWGMNEFFHQPSAAAK